jgi:hypothetical protein
MTFATEAADLYRLAPDRFTAARNARAREIAAGNKPLADRLRKLPRPSAAAVALNLWADADAKGGSARSAFDDLGARFQAAQLHPDRETLTQLDRDRRALVSDTVADVLGTAENAGVKLTAASRGEIEASLQAAIADADAAGAVFSGRLIRSVSSDGLEPADLTDAVAGEDPTRSAQAHGRSTQSGAKRDTAAAKKERAAEAARQAAEAAAKKAEAAVAELDDRLASLASDREALNAEAEELRQRFDDLDARQRKLDERETDLQRQRTKAVRRLP